MLDITGDGQEAGKSVRVEESEDISVTQVDNLQDHDNLLVQTKQVRAEEVKK